LINRRQCLRNKAVLLQRFFSGDARDDNADQPHDSSWVE